MITLCNPIKLNNLIHNRIYLLLLGMTNFNTQDYDFLLRTLNQGSLIFKSESLKRLLQLALNDKKQFSPICKQVLSQLQFLYTEDKQDINLNATLILSQIVSGITSKQHEHLITNNHLQPIIQNLGHSSKPNVRKASHTFLLAYLRAYNNFNSLAKAYTLYGLNNEDALVKQKAINSLQSILILQLKKFEWSSQDSRILFQTLIQKTLQDNVLVAKAAAQCLISLCKIDQIKILAKKLALDVLLKLKQFLENAIETLNVNTLKISPQDVHGLIQNFNKKPKKLEQEEIKVLKPQIPKRQIDPEKDMEATRNNVAHNNTQRRLEKIRNSIKNENKKSSMIQKEPMQSKLFGNVVLEGTIKQKTDAAQQLLFKIQTNLDKPELQASVKTLLPSLIKMLKDSNPKIVGITLKILETIIQFINPNDKNFAALVSVIVQKLGDAKISIRQSVCKVIKELIMKTKKGMWIHELLQNMKKNTNTYLRDQTLGLILNIFEQTPKDEIDYDFQDLLDSIVIYSDDPKTKIKIRTMDCLAQIVLVSDQIQKFNESLKSKMPTIFYQMYTQKVYKLLKQKQKLDAEKAKQDKSMTGSKNLKEEFSTTSRTAYHEKSHYIHKRNESQGDDQTNNKMNVSMDIVKRRVSLLKKPRGLMSTQQTTSVDNQSQRTIDRSLDNTIQDVQVVLPSLYKKTTTNRFITRRDQQTFSPNKTIEHKNSNNTSEYLSKDQLTPLKEPERQFRQIMNSIKSADWKVLFDVTNRLRRLVQFDSEVILNAGQSGIHALMMDVLAMVENLRSSVSKNALLCLNQLIIVLNRQIDSQIDLIFDRVVKKAADTNVFISAQVQKVMTTLAVEATSYKILDKISQFKDSKSIPIKDTCVNCLMKMRQDKKIRQKQFIKLAQSFSYFIFDGSQQIRNKAKAGLVLLCDDLGDWYRALRGKINPSYFKSICQIMTKPTTINRQSPERYSTIRNTPKKNTRAIKQDYQTIKNQRKSLAQTPVKVQKVEPIKKKFVKISNFPSEFESIQTFFQLCSSSDWKKRIEGLNKIKCLALQFQNEFMQYRSANHFIDTICKQTIQPNSRVSLNAMNCLQEVIQPLRSLVQNNLSIVCNSIFSCLSSNKPEIKQKSQELTSYLLEQIEMQAILQYLPHGILYSLPKSRVHLLNKLKDKLEHIYDKKRQLLFKYVFPLMNKLMEEYKSQMIPSIVALFNKLYELMGNQMFSHLTKFKEVKELISH